MRGLGGSLGIALLELLQTRREDFAQQIFAASVTLSNGNVATMVHGARDRAQGLRELGGIVVQNATVVSYDYIFRFCAIVFFISIPTVFLLSKPQPRSEPGTGPVAE